nr:nod factor export ATP-binding protein I-like [Nerophis lumbriciformis]
MARRWPLDGLGLTVPEGAVYVLVGPNGAGKSTTLKALAGLVRVDGGRAEALGLELPEHGAEARAQIGFVADSPDFGYPRLRVSALEVPLESRFGKLSKGQKRRVQLIQALAHRPALLLLDEPTDGLDPLARDLVFGLLAEHLAESPTTALISTHLVHELEGLADCLGVLDRGQLRASCVARSSKGAWSDCEPKCPRTGPARRRSMPECCVGRTVVGRFPGRFGATRRHPPPSSKRPERRYANG